MQKTCLSRVLLSVSLILCASCATRQARTGEPQEESTANPGFSVSLSENIVFIRQNCFEVVTLKPTEDSLSYDKPLNWDLQNYLTRTDKYNPVGTAFAISATELVTAAHVLELHNNSKVTPRRFIREKTREGGQILEKVYEVDSIKAFSNNRDYVVFTVKGRAFSTWFEIGQTVEYNKKIYTAGNAWGEGIVIRQGMLLDAIPEEENGEWIKLKSSIATNPGNSGGPLLDGNFRVIGVVLQRKDDFCYALPMSEIREGKAQVHLKTRFGFSVFNSKHLEIADFERKLPAPYREVMDWYARTYADFYRKGMEAMFREKAPDLFPEGDNSVKALHSARLSTFPQVFLQDSNDLSWFSTQLETTSSDLGNNGRVDWAQLYENAGIWLINIKHPDSLPPGRLINEPKLMMDTVLKGIAMKRTVAEGDSGSRIISNGEPVQRSLHTDRYGRTWSVNIWLMEYADRSVITYALPTPQGVVLFYIAVTTAIQDLWLYDLGKLTDFINVSYIGNLGEWQEFLSKKENRSGPLQNVILSVQPGTSAEFKSDSFAVRFEDDLFPISDENDLILFFDIFEKKEKIVWDIRKLYLDEGGNGDSFYVIYRWQKPDPRLPQSFKDEWKKSVVERIHPYTDTSYLEDGHLKAAAIHPSFIRNSTTIEDRGFVYTLFLTQKGVTGEKSFDSSREKFEKNVTILE